jgi:hypothetical protein
MKMRRTLIAGTLAALLGLSLPAHADRGRGPPSWAGNHNRHEWQHRRDWDHNRYDRIRYSYRRGYRDGRHDRHHHGHYYRPGYWYPAPRYYGPGGYGFNVFLDGIGVSYYESGRYCH